MARSLGGRAAISPARSALFRIFKKNRVETGWVLIAGYCLLVVYVGAHVWLRSAPRAFGAWLIRAPAGARIAFFGNNSVHVS